MTSVAVTAVLFGLLLDGLFSIDGVKPPDILCHTGNSLLGIISAIVLLAVLGTGLVRRLWGRPHAEAHDHEAHEGHADETLHLSIKGMTCSHCAESVTRAMRECPGVESAGVDLKAGTATVTGHGLTLQRLSAAVEALGFKVGAGTQAP